MLDQSEVRLPVSIVEPDQSPARIESMLSTLDALEARLRIGWERLQGYLPQP